MHDVFDALPTRGVWIFSGFEEILATELGTLHG